VPSCIHSLKTFRPLNLKLLLRQDSRDTTMSDDGSSMIVFVFQTAFHVNIRGTPKVPGLGKGKSQCPGAMLLRYFCLLFAPRKMPPGPSRNASLPALQCALQKYDAKKCHSVVVPRMRKGWGKATGPSAWQKARAREVLEPNKDHICL
jgi:hypothetical protein